MNHPILPRSSLVPVVVRGLGVLTAAATVTACQTPVEAPTKAQVTEEVKVPVEIDEESLVFFEALPAPPAPAPDSPEAARIELGRKLFYDTRLSKAHDLSCNSCHGLDTFGVDNERNSKGHRGQRGNRNSPTVYNARFYVAQFWDGRAEDLVEQAKGPVLNPVEMAMPDEDRVVQTLRSIPGYVELFQKAFPGEKEPVTYHNAAAAIAAFEEGLLTPSRFDQFLAGKRDALTDEEKEGLAKFLSLGCTTCHNGPAIGGSSFQRIGQIIPYDDAEDLGRYEVTKQSPDKQVFKVPSLRNVAKTAPYFHNGRFATLEETVRTMARHQLGKTLDDAEVKALVAFLNALTGEIPADYVAKPELPPSGPNTPAPDPT